MSTDLVIGKAGTPHVHSHDFAQLIRGMFGNGKYRLLDKNNCEVVVSPGSVRIKDGGLVWNGRYLRNWDEDPYTYASPASTQTVGVYLHYTKEESTGIEKCDFEVFVGSSAPTTKDNFGDNEYDAYTLFYSFTHNADGTISNESHKFSLIQPHDNIEELISTLTNDAKKRNNERVLLASNVTAGNTITLKENINNFHYFEIVLEGSYARYPTADFDSTIRGNRAETRIVIPSGAANNDGTLPYSGFRNLHLKISGTSFKYARGNTFILNNAGYVSVYDDPIIARVYGVQRKW